MPILANIIFHQTNFEEVIADEVQRTFGQRGYGWFTYGSAWTTIRTYHEAVRLVIIIKKPTRDQMILVTSNKMSWL